MTPGAPDVAQVDSRSLAASLAPLLQSECDDRLGEIRWFKADWQRGGAATGMSTWRNDDGTEDNVVIKLPVRQHELTWTRRLQGDDADPVVPRLYASSDVIGGYDLAWLVMEKFEYGPLGLKWHEDHMKRIAEAVARFQAVADNYEVDQPPRVEEWGNQLKVAQESVRTNELPDRDRWLAALKAFRPRLDDIVAEWRQRPICDWLHGDAHAANAMSRHAMDSGTVSLIDLAEVHAGHWIEDAVYLERQCWARPDRARPVKPVKAVADARKKLGMEVDPSYPRLAMIRRSLLAATAPCYLKTEGHPKHLEACLKWLETAMQELK